jgi:hypothetical protein
MTETKEIELVLTDRGEKDQAATVYVAEESANPSKAAEATEQANNAENEEDEGEGVFGDTKIGASNSTGSENTSQ